jgi:hypothetical protein
MAGSKRITLHGHIVVLHPEEADMIRRTSWELLDKHFSEAQTMGQSHLRLGNFSYVLLRNADHTFQLRRQSDEHRLPL